jgi:hypothetical protein
MFGARALVPKICRSESIGEISEWRYHRGEKMTGACGTMPQKINKIAGLGSNEACAA